MSENMKEENEQKFDYNEDIGYYRNLAQSILKKESAIDLNSIMNLATNLLNNNIITNNAADLYQTEEIPSHHVQEGSDKQLCLLLSSLSEKLDQLADDLSILKQNYSEIGPLANTITFLANEHSKLKKELQNVKEQNEYLSRYVKKIYYKMK